MQLARDSQAFRVLSQMQRTAPVTNPIVAHAQKRLALVHTLFGDTASPSLDVMTLERVAHQARASGLQWNHSRVDKSFARRDDALSCCANGLVLEPVCRSQPQRMEVVALDLFDVFNQRVEIIRDREMATREAIAPSVSQLDDEAQRAVGIGAIP